MYGKYTNTPLDGMGSLLLPSWIRKAGFCCMSFFGELNRCPKMGGLGPGPVLWDSYRDTPIRIPIPFIFGDAKRNPHHQTPKTNSLHLAESGGGKSPTQPKNMRGPVGSLDSQWVNILKNLLVSTTAVFQPQKKQVVTKSWINPVPTWRCASTRVFFFRVCPEVHCSQHQPKQQVNYIYHIHVKAASKLGDVL